MLRYQISDKLTGHTLGATRDIETLKPLLDAIHSLGYSELEVVDILTGKMDQEVI